jgi:exopolysaccharide biosynthesis polyprenyl glycosylphosphotransferase
MSIQMLALLLPWSVLLHSDLPVVATVLALGLMPLLLMLRKRLLASAVRRLQDWNYGTERVVIYGAGKAGCRITSALMSTPWLALHPIALIDEDFGSADASSLELTCQNHPHLVVQFAPITADLLKSLHCDLLIIATPALSPPDMDNLRAIARHAGARVAHLSESELEETTIADCIEVNGLSLRDERVPVFPCRYAGSKRILDIIVSSILLVILSPAFLVIALLIRLNSKGPALFVQKRVGRNGELFRMYKFRSMYRHTPRYERSPKTSRDPRITGLGRFLRRTSLDELPQLLNVFAGQMSLVGPRPEMPFIVNRYNDRQRQRLQVTPGITGLWQLSRDRAYPIHDNLHHDFSYIRHRTLSMDVAILIHTLCFAIGGGV